MDINNFVTCFFVANHGNIPGIVTCTIVIIIFVTTTTIFLLWKYKWAIGNAEGGIKTGKDEIVAKVETQNMVRFELERKPHFRGFLEVLRKNLRFHGSLTTDTDLVRRYVTLQWNGTGTHDISR